MKTNWQYWIASVTDSCNNRCPGCYRVLQNSLVCQNGHMAAALILKNREKILEPRLKALSKNFTSLIRLVEKNKEIFSLTRPRGGTTAFVNYNLKINSDNFCQELIKKYSTLLVPGSVYGLENYFRIGLGTKPEIFETGLKNLEKFIRHG